MSDQSTKPTQLSVGALQGYPIVLLTMAFVTTNLAPDEALTTAFVLIVISSVLISGGILPLYIEGRTTPVFVASVIIVALGSGIGGLGIATILQTLLSDTEIFLTINWGSRVALVLANLAVLTWVFVILKISPITRSLLAATSLLIIASGYTLGYGVFSVVVLVVQGVLQIGNEWQLGIAAVLNGAAIIGWTFLITRKTFQDRFQFAVPVVMIAGLGFVVLGFWRMGKSIFPL